MALDENFETFVIYMSSFNLASAPRIYLSRAAQIVFLLIEEVKISDEYSNFIDVFSEKKTLVLSEYQAQGTRHRPRKR